MLCEFLKWKNRNQYHVRKKRKMDEEAFRGPVNILSKHRGRSQVSTAALPRLFTSKPVWLWIKFFISLYLSFFINKRNNQNRLTKMPQRRRFIMSFDVRLIKTIALLLDPSYFIFTQTLDPYDQKE